MVPTVRPISTDEHRAFVREQPWTSFLQTPAWATVKSEWRGESLGWYDGERLVGAGLVLYRKLPRLARSLAYLPEGPVIDWAADDLADHPHSGRRATKRASRRSADRRGRPGHRRPA